MENHTEQIQEKVEQKSAQHKSIHHVFKEYMYMLMDFIHCLISVVIVIAIAITLLSIPEQISYLTDVGSKSLIGFLEYVINVIIAVELIHVLLHQSLDTIVEILSLAITRELILQQLHTYELLIGVLAIAVLFVIRKYLFISYKDRDNRNDPGYSVDHETKNQDEIARRKRS